MEIETESEPDLRLQRALLIYTGGRDSVAITQHELKDGQIQPGEPLDAAALAELLNKASAKPDAPIKMELTWSDDRLLAENAMYRLWWTPPQQRALFVAAKPYTAWLPGMVWLGSKTRKILFIFAFAGRKKPTQKTTLYRPAFSNVYADCSLCLGSMNPGAGTITEWETGFYNSSFSGSHNLTKKPYAVQKKFKKVGQLEAVIRPRLGAQRETAH